MIKISNGIYYITCGEACLFLHERDNRLEDVCFGRRVEFEDDVTALGLVGGDVFRAEIVRHGENKNLADRLVIKSAEVVPNSGKCAFPRLRAEKTLKVVMTAVGLKVELFFTPHTRGGISRRVAIVNTGAQPVELRSVGIFGMTVPTDMTVVGAAFDRKGNAVIPSARAGKSSRIAVLSENCDDSYGEAIGVYPIYGGTVAVSLSKDKRMEFSLPLGNYVLGSGVRFESPEVLCVYSDCGTGGLMRALHDIVRDSLIAEKYNCMRRPIAFRSAATDCDDIIAGVRTVVLGADTFIADFDGTAEGMKTLEKIGKECAAAGVRLGAVCNFETGKTAVTGKMTGAGGDMTRREVQDAVLETVDKLVGSGVKHIIWKCAAVAACDDPAYEFDYISSVYGLLGAITEKYPELMIAGDGNCADLALLAYMPYFVFDRSNMKDKLALFDVLPPCAVCDCVVPPENVSSSFKTDFDAATVGGLSYTFGAALAGEGICRAVRAQIFSYQDDSALAVGGDVYRQIGDENGCAALVSKDKSRAYVVYCNYSDEPSAQRVKLTGLDPHNLYHVRELGKTFSGAALAGYGVDVSDIGAGETLCLHLRQVADYE